MTAAEFRREHLEPLANLAREQGLYFACLVIEAGEDEDQTRLWIESTAVRIEAGADREADQMLKDRVLEELVPAFDHVF